MDLKTAPHSHTVSISEGIGGSDSIPSLSTIIAIGTPENNESTDRTSEVVNCKSRSMFLLELVQKSGFKRRSEMRAKIAQIRPTQIADLTVFHPGLENRPIIKPIIIHETK